MYESQRAGRPIEVTEETTLASALSGGIGLANRLTFGLVRDVLADVRLATEVEVRAAVGFAASELHQVVEGGAAPSVAGWLRDRSDHAACVLSGGNIDLKVFAKVLTEQA
jgi:threonine dehydratase